MLKQKPKYWLTELIADLLKYVIWTQRRSTRSCPEVGITFVFTSNRFFPWQLVLVDSLDSDLIFNTIKLRGDWLKENKVYNDDRIISPSILHGSISDEFRFTSRRVEGYPFSLTIYVNRQCHVRLSACCESKRSVGGRLGQGFFQLLHVQGSRPCIKYTLGLLRQKCIR